MTRTITMAPVPFRVLTFTFTFVFLALAALSPLSHSFTSTSMMSTSMLSMSSRVSLRAARAVRMAVDSETRSHTDAVPNSPLQLRNQLVNAVSSSVRGATFAGALRLAAAAAVVVAGRPSVAFAANSLEAANNKLSSYGLPPCLFEPPGFSTLVAEYGRGNAREGFGNRQPVLLQFSYPKNWIAVTTTVNENGEAGTVSANDYIKGDSAFYFPSRLATGESLDFKDINANRPLLLKLARSILTQKGDMMDSLKLGDVQEGPKGTDGTQYLIVDLSYDLNTGAGFIVNRRATLSVAAIGDTLHSLTAATTQKRFTELRDSLREIAKSFRVYRLNTGVFSSFSQ